MEELPPSRRQKIVSLRLAPQLHTDLVVAARQANVPLATLVRVLVQYALERLRAGEEELQRAIRITRGG